MKREPTVPELLARIDVLDEALRIALRLLPADTPEAEFRQLENALRGAVDREDANAAARELARSVTDIEPSYERQFDERGFVGVSDPSTVRFAGEMSADVFRSLRLHGLLRLQP